MHTSSELSTAGGTATRGIYTTHVRRAPVDGPYAHRSHVGAHVGRWSATIAMSVLCAAPLQAQDAERIEGDAREVVIELRVQDTDGAVEVGPFDAAPFEADASFEADTWRERLTAADLAERERAYDELRRMAADRPAVRAWIDRTAASGSDELAWTCRLLAREVARDVDAARARRGADGPERVSERGSTALHMGTSRAGASDDRTRRAEWTEMLVDRGASPVVVQLGLPQRGGGLAIRVAGPVAPDDGRAPRDARERRTEQLEVLLQGMDLDALLGGSSQRPEPRWTAPGNPGTSRLERVVAVDSVVDSLLPVVPWARRSELAPAPALDRDPSRLDRPGAPVPPNDVRQAFVAPGFKRLGVRVPEDGVQLGGAVAHGLVVTEVEPMSLAHVLGMVAGDRLLAIDGVPIAAPDEISRAMVRAEERGYVRVRWRSGNDGAILERGFVAVAIARGVVPAPEAGPPPGAVPGLEPVPVEGERPDPERTDPERTGAEPGESGDGR